MYHDEKEIGGVLHYRTTPDGEWLPYTLAGLTAKVQYLKETNDRLFAQISGTREVFDANFSAFANMASALKEEGI